MMSEMKRKSVKRKKRPPNANANGAQHAMTRFQPFCESSMRSPWRASTRSWRERRPSVFSSALLIALPLMYLALMARFFSLVTLSVW
jgi:hypothetical protein